jgi:YD repeat-containing protein
MYCTNCGAKMDDNAKSCPNYGTSVGPHADAASAMVAASQSVGAASRAAAAAQPSGVATVTGTHKGRRIASILAVAAVAAVMVALSAACATSPKGIPLDEDTFPDAGMLAIAKTYDADGNGSLSEDEAGAATSMDVSTAVDVSNLGVFPNLRDVTASGDTVQSISLEDSSVSTVELDSCGSLATFTPNDALESLSATDCTSLTSLDVSGHASLASLSISDSQELSGIDASGCTSLTDLSVSGCPSLSEIDTSGCSALPSLSASECPGLSTVDASGCSSMSELTLSGCAGLTSLDVSDCSSLPSLALDDDAFGSLETVDVTGCAGLTSLSCGDNTDVVGLDTIGLKECWLATDYHFAYTSSFMSSYEGGYAASYSDDGLLGDITSYTGSSLSASSHNDAIALAHDDAGQLTKRSDSYGDWSLTYADGRLETAARTPSGGSSSDATVHYSYDDASQLIQVERDTSSSTTVTALSYDDAGNLAQSSTTTGSNTTTRDFSYDEAGRIATVQVAYANSEFSDSNANWTYRFTYDGSSHVTNVEETLTSGSDNRTYTATYTYDDADRLTGATATYNQVEAETTDISYDKHGNLTAWTITGTSQTSGSTDSTRFTVAYERYFIADEKATENLVYFMDPAGSWSVEPTDDATYYNARIFTGDMAWSYDRPSEGYDLVPHMMNMAYSYMPAW